MSQEAVVRKNSAGDNPQGDERFAYAVVYTELILEESDNGFALVTRGGRLQMFFAMELNSFKTFDLTYPLVENYLRDNNKIARTSSVQISFQRLEADDRPVR